MKLPPEETRREEDILQKRKSYIEVGEVFFWTAPINQWQTLLWEDHYKDFFISSWEYLTNEGKIDVFAFVIMPNHSFYMADKWKRNGTGFFFEIYGS